MNMSARIIWPRLWRLLLGAAIGFAVAATLPPIHAGINGGGGIGVPAGAGGVTSGIAAFEPDNATVSSSTLLEVTAWDTVALAPIWDSSLDYQASEGTLPNAQGWSVEFGSGAVVSDGAIIWSAVRHEFSISVTVSDDYIQRVEALTLEDQSSAADGNNAALLGFGDDRLRGFFTGFECASYSPNDMLRTNFAVSGGSMRILGYPTTVSTHVAEIRGANNAGSIFATQQSLVQLWLDGVLVEAYGSGFVVAPDKLYLTADNSASGGVTGRTTLARSRATTDAPYSTASPTADIVIDLGAGNTATWDMSTILADEREGAGALRYRYEAGAADPGSGDPLNGSDLALATIRTEGDPSGRFLRFRVVFPSDGSVLQPRAWGGGSIAWSIP